MSADLPRPVVLECVEAFAAGTLRSTVFVSHSVARDFSVHVLHGGRTDTPSGFREMFPGDVSFERWEVRREVDPVGDVRALCQLRSCLSRWRPVLVHAHSSKAGALARLAGAAARVPVLYSPHGYAFLRSDVSRLHRTGYRLTEQLLGRLPHVTVACGTGEETIARRLTRNVVRIANAVNAEEWARPVQAKSHGRLRVAGAGRITPAKDFGLFVRIASRMGGAPVEFVWIGGPKPSTTLPSNVRVTGWLPPAAYRAELWASDVFMQTSAWEGLPFAVLEAMASGLPILATPIPGNIELVLPRVNGWLCTSPAAFDAAIRRLQASDLRERLGAASRQLAMAEHDASDAASGWRALYAAVAASQGARTP